MVKYDTNNELCKKLEVSISKKATIILQKPIFRGCTPQFTPLGSSDHGATPESGGVLPLPGFYMMKYNTNDELCKRLEVSNFRNTTVISETPILWGVTPSLPP